MNLRILRLLGVAAGLALASASTLAQEPPAPEPSANAAAAADASTASDPAVDPVATAEPAPAAPLKLSNKWRIEVSEGANNDGTLLFRVTPDQGTPTDVLVTIKKGRSENGVARDIKNALKAKLDPKTYQVENDDGEDVLVKRRKGPNYEVRLVESTLKGTRIDIEKE